MSHGLGVSCPAALGSGLHAVQLPVLSLTFTSGNSSTSHWLQPWPRQKLMDIWMGCNNKVSLGTGGKAMKSVDLIVSCYKTVLLTLLLAHLVVDAPFLKLFKAKRHGALGWPSAWSATLLMAGGLELDDLWGPFKSKPFNDSLADLHSASYSQLKPGASVWCCAPWHHDVLFPAWGFGVWNLNPQSYLELWLITNLQTCEALLHFCVPQYSRSVPRITACEILLILKYYV